MARSKSKSMPPARLALLNTEQKQSLDTSGQMLVTPLSQMVPAEDPPAFDMLPKRLFQDLPATSPNDVEQYVQQSALLAGSSQKVPVAISVFADHRAKWPPLDPRELARDRSHSCGDPSGMPDAMDFIFACEEQNRLDKI